MPDWLREYAGADELLAALRAFYADRTVLVTGGASFIGSHLAELLVAAGSRVLVADDLSSGRLQHLHGIRDSVEFRRGDLRDASFAAACARDRSIVFHLAAAHGGRGYIEAHPVECLGNIALDHVVFRAAAAARAQKIVFASSACVYPTRLQESTSERLLLREEEAGLDGAGAISPDGEYGWAKLTGEVQLRAFARQHGIAGVACRIFTSYGERENATHSVIALIAKAVARLDPYPIWGDGLQTRNFTHVHDTVIGLALAGARLDGAAAVNVGSERHHSILELVEEIFAALDWRPRQIHRELERPTGVKSRAADNTRCRQLLGWSPRVSLRDGVRRTLQWYLATEEARPRDLERALVEH